MNWKRGLIYFSAPLIVFFFSVYLTIDVLLRTEGNVICPDVRGKTVEQAKDIVRSRGLSLLVLRYENRNDVPYNHITLQKPEANIPIRKGRVIHVIVSEGPKLIEVPTLTGKSLQEAAEIVTEKNFELGRIVPIPHASVGTVVAQIPQGGQKVLERREIILLVGAEEVKYFLMPDPRTLELAEIQGEMDAKHIKYRTEFVWNDLYPPSPSIRISVPARSIFKGDREVLIQINSGGWNG